MPTSRRKRLLVLVATRKGLFIPDITGPVRLDTRGGAGTDSGQGRADWRREAPLCRLCSGSGQAIGELRHRSPIIHT